MPDGVAQLELCFALIAKERITSFFAPPTVWIAFLRHTDFDRHDLSSLKNGYYGASWVFWPTVTADSGLS